MVCSASSQQMSYSLSQPPALPYLPHGYFSEGGGNLWVQLIWRGVSTLPVGPGLS